MCINIINHDKAITYKQVVRAFIILILLLFLGCNNKEYQIDQIINNNREINHSNNLFVGCELDSIRYFIVNPFDSNRVNAIDEFAKEHYITNEISTIRVDSIDYANMIIRL